MSELIAAGQTAERMSSMDIAEYAGKKHNKVVRDIKSLIEQDAIGESSFGLTSYTTDQNKKHPMYLLDFKATMTLVTGYDAKRRGQVITRWVELEGKAKDPMVVLNDPAALRGFLLDYSEKIIALESSQKENAPRVALAEAIEASDRSIQIREYVKLISKKSGFVIGANNFYKWLRDDNLVDHRNVPYQRFIDSNWFEMKTGTYPTRNGPRPYSTTMITGKGQVSIFNRFKKSDNYKLFLNKRATA